MFLWLVGNIRVCATNSCMYYAIAHTSAIEVCVCLAKVVLFRMLEYLPIFWLLHIQEFY